VPILSSKPFAWLRQAFAPIADTATTLAERRDDALEDGLDTPIYYELKRDEA
jgi:hypothetical protein